MADVAVEGRALAERIGVVPLEKVFSRPGTRFLAALDEGDAWMVHPSGYGIIIANPERAPRWVRIVDGKVVDTAIEVSGG